MLIVAGPVVGEDHHRRGHPERPERLGAVMDGIDDLHLGDELRLVEARPATRQELALVHSVPYLEGLRRFCAAGGGELDADTYAGTDSWSAATLAAGAGLVAVEALRQGRGDVAFVAARPPGHHALADRPMGFCLVNNVAVAAASLVAAGERVLIVDWDVHHGNGTQSLFWDEPAVLYVSTHQWPCYPGTGRPSEVGGPGARGSTLNVPLPPGATGDVVREALDRLVAPAVDRFRPTWVLVSAGFDAHRADPLADLALTSGDFAQLATVVAGYAPSPGHLVLFLEGGYDLESLRASVAASLGALLGTGAPSEAPSSGGPGRDGLELVEEARRAELDDRT